jgi:hypothetical protein
MWAGPSALGATVDGGEHGYAGPEPDKEVQCEQAQVIELSFGVTVSASRTATVKYWKSAPTVGLPTASDGATATTRRCSSPAQTPPSATTRDQVAKEKTCWRSTGSADRA